MWVYSLFCSVLKRAELNIKSNPVSSWGGLASWALALQVMRLPGTIGLDKSDHFRSRTEHKKCPIVCWAWRNGRAPQCDRPANQRQCSKYITVIALLSPYIHRHEEWEISLMPIPLLNWGAKKGFVDQIGRVAKHESGALVLRTRSKCAATSCARKIEAWRAALCSKSGFQKYSTFTGHGRVQLFSTSRSRPCAVWLFTVWCNCADKSSALQAFLTLQCEFL